MTPSSSIQSLEFNRFLELAGQEACSEPAKNLILQLLDSTHWAPNMETAMLRQEETFEVSDLLNRDPLWNSVRNLKDPEPWFESLSRGSVLEVQDLAGIRAWCEALTTWCEASNDRIRGELIKKALLTLVEPFEELRMLNRILTPTGELSEKASPKLASLYSEIRSLKKEIETRMEGLLRQYSSKGILQDQVSDFRDGHYLIPVRVGSQGEIDGTIFDSSSSKMTVFVEPQEISPWTQKLRQKQGELVQEIFVILESACRMLAKSVDTLRSSCHTLYYWDAVQARARIARVYGGRRIQLTTEREIRLRFTAHPLLWWAMPAEQIIRNDLEIFSPHQALILSGPNAGGKTVFMKTLGLAGILARTGFFFPGTDPLVIPFFDTFHADFGDPQSIESHLSTFSGHIERLKRVLETSTRESFVLIDELNSSTDPQEGAALARALIEELLSRGSMVITTTHDPILKGFSLQDPRIACGSVHFDETSKTPTFRLTLGTPGRSRAIETASRLGLQPSVIELARSYLSTDHIRFETLLSQLEEATREADDFRKQAAAMKLNAEKLRDEWTSKAKQEVKDLLEKTKARLKRILEEAQDQTRVITRTRDLEKQSYGKIMDALREEAPGLAEIVERETPVESPSQRIFKVGETVRVPKWKKTGVIIDISGNRAKVQMGAMPITLELDEIEHATASEAAEIQEAKKKKRVLEEVSTPPEQIDIRGMRLDDAIREVEVYLDHSYRSRGRVEVRIVHGLGTGALREGVRDLLKKLPYIKSVRDGGAGGGGTGATVIEFDL